MRVSCLGPQMCIVVLMLRRLATTMLFHMRPLPHFCTDFCRLSAVNNTARQLLEACGYIAGKDGGSSSSKGGSGKGKKR